MYHLRIAERKEAFPEKKKPKQWNLIKTNVLSQNAELQKTI